MKDTPDVIELLEAVKGYLEAVRGQLSGHAAFHALVAINTLEIVAREIEHGDARRREELVGLEALLRREGDADSLTEALCRAIGEGELAVDDAALLDFLDRTTLGRLAIDQPAYSGARIARESS